MNCTRCQGTGFLNPEFLPDGLLDSGCEVVLEWLKNNPDVETHVCDCCGNGDDWYGEPGSHYSSSDPIGHNGPYAYNGGLCECH